MVKAGNDARVSTTPAQRAGGVSNPVLMQYEVRCTKHHYHCELRLSRIDKPRCCAYCNDCVAIIVTKKLYMRAFAILFAPLVFLLLSSCSLLLDYDLHTVVPQASTRVDAELVSLTVVEAPSDQRTGTTFRLTD